MKQSIFTFGLILLALLGVAHAQPVPRDTSLAGGPLEKEAPFIDVLTFGVGDQLFEKYGHSAICIRYHEARNIEVCFNFGYTNFAAGSALAWNFLRGTQEFWVEPSSYRDMAAIYQWEDRDIFRQTLPLTAAEARAIEEALWGSLEADKKYYIYDHYFDNCATRIRDLVDRATHGKLSANSDAPYALTFRQLAAHGAAEMPEVAAISDFVMGRQADDTPTVWQAMFLPDVLRAEIATRFGVTPELLSPRHGPPFPVAGAYRLRVPMLLIALLFAVPLAIVRFAPMARRRRWLDKLVVVWASVPLIVWGLVIWSLAIISSIPMLRWNELALVFVPLDLAIPFLGEVRRRRYARVRLVMIVLASLLLAIGVFHQPMWIPLVTAFLPFALLA